MNNNEFPILTDSNYHIESVLGSGGGGVVYKAWHARLQKHVALKRVTTSNTHSASRAEVDMLKNLKHAGLPQVYDFLAEESGVYTVMEFIPGKSLAQALSGGQRFSQKQVIKWAQELSGALAYLHGRKPSILHSDIKPANIMLTPEGEICLIDFNISLLLDGVNADAIGRSHGYASPEQYGPQALPRPLRVVPESGSAILQETETLNVYEQPKQPEFIGSQNRSSETEHIFNSENSGVTEKLHSDTTGQLHQNVTEKLYQNDTETLHDNVTERPHYYATEKLHSDITETAFVTAPQASSSKLERAKIRMDARSDIYSLGATLYHLLTGEKPAIASGEVKPLSAYKLGLSEAIVYIIERCMERDPSKRFQTADELHRAFCDIHKLDSRWTRHVALRSAAIVILSALFTLSGVSAAFGWQLMGEERLASYNELVHQIPTAQTGEPFNLATDIFPDRLEAFRAEALRLHNQRAFEECIAFIHEAMARFTAFTWSEDDLLILGDIFYIEGNAWFELGLYPRAVSAYEAAVSNNPTNPEMFRDYAIALARMGHVEQAEELLISIQDMAIGHDSIQLLQGEIAYARRNYEEAVTLFHAIIDTSNNSFIRKRAYLIADRAYRRLPNRIDDRIILLRGALVDLPSHYQTVLMERLADALTQAGEAAANPNPYYSEAIALFTELRARGNISYATAQNIGLLYQRMGNFTAAHEAFLELVDTFPEDYRPLMRLAYLVLEEQSALPNEERDFSEVALWYAQSRELYDRRPSGAGDDMEMLMLQSLVAELRQQGWID